MKGKLGLHLVELDQYDALQWQHNGTARHAKVIGESTVS
jgi:hypothetical protein